MILDKEAPLKVRQYRRNYAGWMDNQLKDTEIRRDELRNIAAASETDGRLECFQKIQEQI